MSASFCPRCGAATTADPCPACGRTSQGATARASFGRAMRKVARRPGRALAVWLPATLVAVGAAGAGSRAAALAFPQNALGAAAATFVVLAACFVTLGVAARPVASRRGGVVAAGLVAAACAAAPWALALLAGAWIQTRPAADLAAAVAQVLILVLVALAALVAARVHPAAIEAACEAQVARALAEGARASRARGGLAVTLVGALTTMLVVSACGAAAALVLPGAVLAVQGIALWSAFAAWGTWAVEAATGPGAGASFSCPRCGGAVEVHGGQATCPACRIAGPVALRP